MPLLALPIYCESQSFPKLKRITNIVQKRITTLKSYFIIKKFLKVKKP